MNKLTIYLIEAIKPTRIGLCLYKEVERTTNIKLNTNNWLLHQNNEKNE